MTISEAKIAVVALKNAEYPEPVKQNIEVMCLLVVTALDGLQEEDNPSFKKKVTLLFEDLKKHVNMLIEVEEITQQVQKQVKTFTDSSILALENKEKHFVNNVNNLKK